MKRLDTSNPERLMLRSGGGCARVFCACMLLGGIFLAVSPLLREQLPAMRVNEYLAVPVGVIGALVGFIGLFAHTWVTVDRVDRTVSWGWRMLGFGRWRRRPFDAFDAARIVKHVRSSGSEHRHRSTFVDYQVVLVSGETEVTVGEGIPELDEAHKLASEVAGLVGVEVREPEPEPEPEP
ncbi:MAG: hypothetical protein ACYTGB_09730 [Planctomycetota bacterium]|jgi:hypothetical protein